MWCYLAFLSLVYLFTVVFLIFLGPALTQQVILAQAIELSSVIWALIAYWFALTITVGAFYSHLKTP